MFTMAFIAYWVKCFLNLERSVIYGDKSENVNDMFNVSNGKWKQQINNHMFSKHLNDVFFLGLSIIIDSLIIYGLLM